MLLTSLNLVRLHILPRHGVVLDDVWQGRGGEVLLARLLLGSMLPGILLHGLEPVLLATVLVLRLFKKLSRLLAHLQHPMWW